jgi:hypothetical protein
MKIGILTFYDASNYGALLQACALQKTLKELGCDSEFVNIRRNKKPTPAASPLAKRLGALKAERDRLLGTFRDEYLTVSKCYEPGDPIDDDYDAFIAGSDQIWNTSIPDVDSRYFLPFASFDKRYSYAAGFGEGFFSDNNRNWIAGQLKQFKQISVREEAGRAIVKELTGRDSIVCIDPVFLQPEAEWRKLVTVRQRPPYVFLFLLQYDAAFAESAKQAAAERGLEVVTVSAGYMPQLGFDAWTKTSVTDWLSYIANAELVYTDSFHATAFSMIFGREFRHRALGGDLEKRNSRTAELLSLSEEQLRERKEQSLAYLKGIINDGNDM